MNIPFAENIKWSENIIIVDADYIDHVAFHLIVNFERMLGRQIPQADLSQWLVNIALDGKVKQGENEIQVVFLHDKNKAALENYTPSYFEKAINQQAFKDPMIGEFILNTIATGGSIVDKDEVLIDLVATLFKHPEVKRIMIVPNAEEVGTYQKLRQLLNGTDDEDKKITVFAMEPMPGGNFKQQILGFSLLNAMGISANEIDNKIK